MNIIDFIPTGKENSISFENLRIASGVKDPGQLRHAIEKARNNGAVICSDGDGYYLAEYREDLRHTIHRFNSRAKKNAATRDALMKAAEELPSVRM